jgi:hypothetical protein
MSIVSAFTGKGTTRIRWVGVAVLTAAAMLVAGSTGAHAAVGGQSSGGMLLNAGSQRVSLVSSQPITDGRLRSTWVIGGNGRVTVTAPAGSSVIVGGSSVEIAPPLSWRNPCDHCWYNAIAGRFCRETCVYGSSNQYALQEVSGEWYVGNHITGTVYPGSGSAKLGEAYNRFLSEHGDSGALNYKPSGDSCPSSGGSWNWSFSFQSQGVGFSFGESQPLSGGSCYGPVAPSGWGQPAFGSRWWSNGQRGNHGIGSFDAIHLGHHQSPYDALWLVVAA